jgi:hypothetical protein
VLKFQEILICKECAAPISCFSITRGGFMKIGLVGVVLFSSLLADTPGPEIKCIPTTEFSPSCYQYPAGYTAPAAVNLQKKWSTFFDVGFIYWSVDEDGLTLAQNAILSQGSQVTSPNAKFCEFTFDYYPGFKAALGVIYDNEWNVNLRCTGLHASMSLEEKPPANTSTVPGFSVWNLNDWFQQTATFSQYNSPQAQSLSALKIVADWKLDLYMLDACVERASYIGSNFVISPVAGLRSVWIGQSVKVGLFQPAAAVGGAQYLEPQPILSKTKSKNYCIGPIFGCEAYYLLPLGWRITAHGAGSLLATRSTTLKHKEDPQSIAVNPGPYRIDHAHYQGILPNAEIGLGIGWGKYLGNHHYYLDFSASYDFTIFWAQNVMRQMLDEAWSGTRATSGNLSFDGLTLNAHLSF